MVQPFHQHILPLVHNLYFYLLMGWKRQSRFEAEPSRAYCKEPTVNGLIRTVISLGAVLYTIQAIYILQRV
jgi:hypothetical protein